MSRATGSAGGSCRGGTLGDEGDGHDPTCPPAAPLRSMGDREPDCGYRRRVLKWLSVAALAAAALWWWFRARAIHDGRTDLADATVSRDFIFTIVLLLVVTSRVLSPQFMLWLVGLAAVVLTAGTTRMARPAWIVLGASILSTGVFGSAEHRCFATSALIGRDDRRLGRDDPAVADAIAAARRGGRPPSQRRPPRARPPVVSSRCPRWPTRPSLPFRRAALEPVGPRRSGRDRRPSIRFRGSIGTTLSGRGAFLNYVENVRAAFPDWHNRST